MALLCVIYLVVTLPQNKYGAVFPTFTQAKLVRFTLLVWTRHYKVTLTGTCKAKKKGEKNLFFLSDRLSLKYSTNFSSKKYFALCDHAAFYPRAQKAASIISSNCRAWGENCLRNRPSMALHQLLSLNQSTSNKDSCFSSEHWMYGHTLRNSFNRVSCQEVSASSRLSSEMQSMFCCSQRLVSSEKCSNKKKERGNRYFIMFKEKTPIKEEATTKLIEL